MTWLFYVLIAILPLEQHWFWRMELVGTFTVIKVVGLTCLIAALMKLFVRGAHPRFLRGPLARFYVALLVCQCGSYFFHGDDMDVGLEAYSNVVSILALLIVVLTFIDSFKRLFTTLLIAICAAGFASLYTIRGQQGGGIRPSGIFEDANYYALAVGLWLPLAYTWALSRRPLWERVLCGGCFVSMLLGSVFAASRGGFLGLAAAFLFLLCHSSHRMRNLAILTVLTVPVLFYAPNSPLQRFLNPSYSDVEAKDARVIAWKAAIRMIRAHPVTGVGLANFKPLVTQYEDGDSTVISIAHNTYLETAAELGIPALLIHLGLIAASFITLGRVRRRARARQMQHLGDIALALQAGLLCYAVSAVFLSTWWQQFVWVFLFLPLPLDRLIRRAAVVTVTQTSQTDTLMSPLQLTREIHNVSST